MSIYDAGERSSTGRRRTGTEVFTPRWLVDDMLDMLERESPEIFQPEKTFLEPACGEGAFVLEILRRKFRNCKTRLDYRAAIASVYGMDIQPDNIEATIKNVIELCREYFKPNKDDIQTINDRYIMCDSLKVMRLLAQDNRLSVYGWKSSQNGE